MTTSLQDSRAGDILVLTHFDQEDEDTNHLRRHGLVEGTQLVVLKSGSRPLVRCGASTIALSPPLAERVVVAHVGREATPVFASKPTHKLKQQRAC